jgi:hypothetical protein
MPLIFVMALTCRVSTQISLRETFFSCRPHADDDGAGNNVAGSLQKNVFILNLMALSPSQEKSDTVFIMRLVARKINDPSERPAKCAHHLITLVRF